MTTVFIIREEPQGLWTVDRDGVSLIKHDSAAAAIADGRELARMIHGQSGAAVTVALQAPDTTILLARYAKPAPVLKMVVG
jgi:hypothetical protein